MPTYYASKRVASRAALPESDHANDPCTYIAEFLIVAGMVSGDVIEMAGVPANHVVDSVSIMCDQIDSNGSPTLTLDVGYMTGIPGVNDSTRTIGQDFFTGNTLCRTGGVVACTDVKLGRQVASTADRAIGFKFAANAATLVAGARLRCRVQYVSDPGLLT